MLPNLDGFKHGKSSRTANIGPVSCTTGSWKRKLGTTPERIEVMLDMKELMAEGMGRFCAMDHSGPVRSDGDGDVPGSGREPRPGRLPMPGRLPITGRPLVLGDFRGLGDLQCLGDFQQ
jgi:hypothetical protein